MQLPTEVEMDVVKRSPASVGGTKAHNATTLQQPTDTDIMRLPHTDTRSTNGNSEAKLHPLAANGTIKMYLLGQFHIERRCGNEWSAVTNRTWHRRRARALLGLLLSNPGRRLGRERPMEALWPHLDTETAANSLNGAVHELRQILDPGIARPAASRMLRLEREVLELADRTQIWVDAEAFEDLLKEANTTADPEQVERILEEAGVLYGGDYLLEELYSEWAAPRREALRRGWMGLLLNLADLRAARGALASAIEPLDRLLATDPTNETAVRRLMLLLTQLDRRGEALQVYHRLASLLQREYESDPLPETSELYEALRQGHTNAVSQIKTPLQQTQALPFPHVVGPLVSISQLGRSNQSPLVGRNRELDTMRQAMLSIEEATQNVRPPHFLLLMGEAGIGKTRLAEELSHEVNTRGWAVAWSRAYEQEGTIPYRPWTELLRTLLLSNTPKLFSTLKRGDLSTHIKLERLSALLPEILTTTQELVPQPRLSHPLPPEQERLHLWEATLELLSALSKKAPLLLVLDDLHWTDDSSLELLAYLTRHLQDQRILLLGTCRDVELTPTHSLRTLITDLRREQAIVTLHVQPLTQSQIGSLVAHLPENIVQSIQTQAAGNPFFAEELARGIGAQFIGPEEDGENQFIAPQEEVGHNTSRPASSLPEAIAAVLDRRLSRLSDECQSLLGKAAVLGGSFEFNHLLFMANEQGGNEDSILDLLEEALRAGLLTEEDAGTRINYHFWHPLIVSHLYERLSAARRAQLHRRAANAMRLLQPSGHEGAIAAAITHHLIKGGGDPLQIAHYAELAGNQAYSLAAYAEAQHYYCQAVEMISGGRLQMTGGIGVPHSVPSQVTKNQFLDAAPKPGPADDPLHLARLLERICECTMVQGNYQEARSLYEYILQLRNLERTYATETERQREAQIQALIWREIGRTWSCTGEYAHGHECYKRGKQVLYEVGVTAGAAWACLHLEQGATCWQQGNYDEARRCVQEALEMLEQVMSSRPERPTANQFQTRTERAIHGDPWEIGHAHERLGVIAATVGQRTEALKHLNTALAIYEEHGLVMAMAQVCGNIGTVHATRAENSVARTYYRRSLELTERMGDLPNMAFVTGNLGEMAARSGDLQEAEEWFKRSLALAERVNDREHSAWCNVALATALQDQGNLQDAAIRIRRALHISRGMKSVRYISSALVALGGLRVAQTIRASMLQDGDCEGNIARQSALCNRLLRRARSTLQRALALEGLEAEVATEGQLVLASVYFLLGDLEVARQKAMQTKEKAQQQEIIRILGRSQRLLGRILAAQGEHEQADQYFEQAIQVFHTHEMRLDYARAIHGYGVILLQRSTPGDQTYQRGLAYLHEARNIFADCHAAIDLEWIERIITSAEAPLTQTLEEKVFNDR